MNYSDEDFSNDCIGNTDWWAKCFVAVVRTFAELGCCVDIP